ncbi:MAG: DUF2029 domain-containing protein [Austwickia sp.]|nr:MAG: DUF2029 domain-containing protein [Austwickia sp.]
MRRQDQRFRLGSLVVLLGALGVVAYFTATGLPTDLEVYRRSAQQAFDGRDHIYDTPYGLLPFTYPPLAIFLFAPLAAMPDLVASAVMCVASLAALYRLTVLLLRAAAPAYASWALLVLPLAAALEPVWATLSFGQVNLVLAWIIAEDVLGLAGPRARRWRGALIGLATIIKLTPGIFVLVLLFRRDWASLGRTAAAFVVGVGLGFLVWPHSSWEFWTTAMRDPRRVGGVAFSGNQSLNGAVWRAVGEGGSTALWGVLVLAVLASTAYVLGRLGPHGDPVAALLACAFAGLLVSPVSWSHHWVWIWAFLVWAGAVVVRRRVWNGERAGSLRAGPGPAGPVRAVAGVALLWAAAAYSRVIWWFPHRDDQEYAVGPLGKLLTDAYAVAGLATLVVLAMWAGSAARRGARAAGQGRIAA